jgi:hypothetical protein
LIAEQDVNYLTSTFSIISKKCGMNFFIVQRRDRTSSSPASSSNEARRADPADQPAALRPPEAIP